MTAQPVSAYHKQLCDLLAPFADSEARETGFLKRQSKLSGRLFVLVLVSCFWSKTPRALAAYARRAESLQPGLTVTAQSLHERFTHCAVALLKRVLAAALQIRFRPTDQVAPCLASFSALYILDSTTLALPEALKIDYRGSGGAASPAAVKCFWLLEWFTATTQQILLEEGVKADQNMGTPMLAQTRPGALWLFDLGFWSITFLVAIAKHRSVFVSRLHGSVTVRTPTGEPIDQMHWLRSVGQVCERQIALGTGERLACRMIAERVPEAVAAERRRKCKEGARRRGRTLRAETLERRDWTVWVTNVEEAILNAKHVKEIYRIRWQVELLFKLAKSTAGLKQVTSEKKERIECELYAGLIALVIAGHLRELAHEQAQEAISAVKLWNALEEKIRTWSQALLEQKGDRALRELLDWIIRHAKPTKRKATPSTYTRIKNLGLAPPRAATHAP